MVLYSRGSTVGPSRLLYGFGFKVKGLSFRVISIKSLRSRIIEDRFRLKYRVYIYIWFEVRILGRLRLNEYLQSCLSLICCFYVDGKL